MIVSSGTSPRRGRFSGLLARRCLSGAVVALLALALLDLIALITHLAYMGTLSTSLTALDIHVLGVWSVLVQVVGGLIVGVMPRAGSIRAHASISPHGEQQIWVPGRSSFIELEVTPVPSSGRPVGVGT